MGMTDDFDIAVEEGATMVRVGRALFGARARPELRHGGDLSAAVAGPAPARSAASAALRDDRRRRHGVHRRAVGIRSIS